MIMMMMVFNGDDHDDFILLEISNFLILDQLHWRDSSSSSSLTILKGFNL
jgi:hypothetical protein